jgi:hypothetical protein
MVIKLRANAGVPRCALSEAVSVEAFATASASETPASRTVSIRDGPPPLGVRFRPEIELIRMLEAALDDAYMSPANADDGTARDP